MPRALRWPYGGVLFLKFEAAPTGQLHVTRVPHLELLSLVGGAPRPPPKRSRRRRRFKSLAHAPLQNRCHVPRDAGARGIRGVAGARGKGGVSAGHDGAATAG